MPSLVGSEMCIRDRSNGAVSTTPAWVTEAFVRLFGATNTVSAAVIFAYHDGAVTSLPPWHTVATTFFTNTITCAHTSIFHRTRWHITSLAGVVRVTGTKSIHFAFTISRAILRAARHGTVYTSPPWVTGTVAFAASTVV